MAFNLQLGICHLALGNIHYVNMIPLISVIVPIYNAEAYLEKCLESICDQTLRNIEILCVDDHSSDHSSAIVRDLAALDSRIRLIRHAANLGPGGARNTGVKAARAGYIASVDSDDWLDSTMLQTLHDATDNESIDVVCCGWKRVNQYGVESAQQGRKPGLFDNRNNDVNIFELLNPALWNKLIRKNLITDNQIEFPRYVTFEDLATTPRLVAHANSIKIIDEKPYNYVRRENSLVTSYDLKQLMGYFEAFSTLRKFLLENSLYERYAFEYRGMIDKHLSFCCEGVLQSDLEQEKKNSFLKYIYFLKSSFLAEIGTVDKLSNVDLENILMKRRPATAIANIAKAA